MKHIIKFFTVAFLLTHLGLSATILFQLTNESTKPIWVTGYVNEDDLFTGEDSRDAEKRVLPGDFFVKTIENGEVEVTISVVEPGSRNGQNKFRTYKTLKGADSKNKVLIWNHTKYPAAPLYPASRTRFMGLSTTTIKNNINKKEFRLTKYNLL